MRKLLILFVVATFLSCAQQKQAQKATRPSTINHAILIKKLLDRGEKVCLVVLPDKYQDNRDSWFIAGAIFGSETILLKHFGGYSKNFSLVDRTITSDILNELALHHSGAVPEKLRIKLGELYGITHILMVGGSSWGKIITKRLIEVETGRILTMDRQYYQ